MENKIEREFKVPEHSFEWLDKQFAKLNKRAKKLGVAEVSYTIIGEEINKITHVGGEKLEVPEYRTWKIVKVEGEAPKFAGWEFLGRLDHNEEHGNIFSAVPGKNIPEQYRNVSRYSCEHCNKNIYRTETFVVQHESGEVKQVGRQCIRDFLGHNSPEKIVGWAEWWIRFEDLLEDDDGGWDNRGGGRSEKWWERSYDLEMVLTYSVACIREYGWTSGGEARNDYNKISTSTRVTDNIIDRHKKLKNWREAETLVHPTDEDGELAKKARAWVQELDPEGNDYFGNLKVIASQDYVNGKQWGLAVSMISAYKRHVEKKELAKRTNKKNEWFGEVKDKVELTVQVIRVFEIEGTYGVSYLHKMLTEEGYSVDWWCSNYDNSMDQGCWYKIKGTVQDHIEYKEWKSTKLTRCKVLEEIDQDHLKEREVITDEDINLEEK